jgi:hypothetical protein
VARDPEESEFGASEFPEARNSCNLKSRSAISRRGVVWATAEDSGGQVSLSIGDRDLESSVKKCNGNRDIPIRDFPITTGVWAIGARAKDRVEIVLQESSIGSGA